MRKSINDKSNLRFFQKCLLKPRKRPQLYKSPPVKCDSSQVKKNYKVKSADEEKSTSPNSPISATQPYII